MRKALTRLTIAIGALSGAACGGQSGSIPAPAVHEPAYATQAGESLPVSLLTGGVRPQTQEAVLYSFAGGSDGENPESAALTNVNGVLYGTTPAGGANGKGTVFAVATSGAETVLHTFGTGSDGAFPYASLTSLNGVLYGANYSGGANGKGTVFEITAAGAESVLYSFAGGSDGANPYAGLTAVNGVLYGTTFAGGANAGNGTVFKLTTSGTESVLYSFANGSDGANPQGSLTNLNGVLYGTTFGGGTGGDNGTVFKITTSGAESVLYSFSGSDGAQPLAGLTNINGVLYGTTELGGAGGRNFGTVFKITTSGAEKVLHSFGGGSDGRHPYAGLTNVNGVLYGTTYAGGRDSDNGTVFKITTAGAKTVLYSFSGLGNGASPRAGLANVNGVLYGTTAGGGTKRKGTVFSLSL